MPNKHKTLTTTLFILLILSIGVINPLWAQEKAAKIDELLSKYYEYNLFNGSVLAADGGKVIYEKGFGYANVEHQIPNTPETKFRLASVTKQFTAMLIMQLVEEKKIDLNEKIETYLPDYADYIDDRITVHHLLTHSSGIHNYTDQPDFPEVYSRLKINLDKVIKGECTKELDFTPGERFKYSNTGYYLLGAIVEQVTGNTYAEVLKKRILDPLEMNNSGLDDESTILENRAYGYARAAGELQVAPFMEIENAFAAGGMYSTTQDLYKWDQALYDDKLVGKKYRKMIFKPQIESGNGGAYGYGWGIRKMSFCEGEDSVLVVQHMGGLSGFNTIISRIPEDKHLIVILNNVGFAPLTEMIQNIGKILYDKPYDMPKKSIIDTLASLIDANGVEAALAEYKSLKENHPDEYNFDEYQLNQLGYRLLGRKKIDEAI